MRSMRRVANRLFGNSFQWEGVSAGGNLDPLIFAQAAKNSGLDNLDEHHEQFRQHYVVELEGELKSNAEKIRIMPGIIELIDHLHERAETRQDVVLGLLTGNYTDATSVKLRSIGMDMNKFRITALGDEAPTRAELVALAMQRYKDLLGHPADPLRVIVIGDTIKDVACAKANGCVAFAVGTGMSTMDELTASGADVVVSDLSDHSPLLKML